MPRRTRTGEPAVADEGCGCADEGEAVCGRAFTTAGEPTAAGRHDLAPPRSPGLHGFVGRVGVTWSGRTAVCHR